jgi:hypothetical protein
MRLTIARAMLFAAALICVTAGTTSGQQKQGVSHAGWVSELDSLSMLLQRGERILDSDIARAEYVLAAVRSADSEPSELAARAVALLQALTSAKSRGERTQKIGVVNRQIDELKVELVSARWWRGALDVSAWTSLFAGAALTGTACWLWYMAEDTFASYKASTLTARTLTLRGRVQLFDGLTIGIGVTGLVSLLATPVIFSLGPQPDEIDASIHVLEERLQALAREEQ